MSEGTHRTSELERHGVLLTLKVKSGELKGRERRERKRKESVRSQGKFWIQGGRVGLYPLPLER